MSDSKIEPKSQKKLDKAKEVIKNNWKPFTVGVIFTGVTLIVTKRFTMRYLPISGTNVLINKAVVNDEGSLYNVYNIYGSGFKNHGPSWMVKCKETGILFRSQEHAAKTMKISESLLSTHLNGKMDSVAGYHFERVGMAA